MDSPVLGEDVDVDVDAKEVLEDKLADTRMVESLAIGNGVGDDVEVDAVFDSHVGSSVALFRTMPYAATLSSPDLAVIVVLAYTIG